MKAHSVRILILIVLISIIIINLTLAQPQDEIQQSLLIEGFISDGMYEQALTRIKQFIADFPQSPRSEHMHYLLGEVHFRLDDFAAAEKVFLQFLQDHDESPDLPQAMYLLATSYQFQDNFAGAKQILNKLLRDRDIDDDLRAAIFKRRASVHLMLGEQESARRDLEEFLDINDSREERVQLAHLLYEMGELRDAERQYERLLERPVSDREQMQKIISRYAMVRYQREDYRDVVEFLEPRIREFMDDELIVGTLAWSYYQLEEYEKAYSLYSSRTLSQETSFNRQLNMARQMLLISEHSTAIE